MDFSFPEAWVHLSWALTSSGDHTPPAAINFMSSPSQKKRCIFSLAVLKAQRAFIKRRRTQRVVTVFVYLRFLVCCARFPK